jgi:uncharacterized protein (DUF58 family)
MLLTDPAFIRQLESLTLLSRKVLGGTLQADRKSLRKGSGTTFADYSEYSPGDDYRAIDWRVFARLDNLVIKLFELEEDVTLYFLLDASRSMETKFLYARQLVAALAYVAVHGLDKVVIYGMADDLACVAGPTQGRGKLLAMLRMLETARLSDGSADFSAAARRLCGWQRRRGMVITVSDFLFPGGFEEGLQLLQWNHHDLFCIQVQDRNDRRCDLRGDVELACVETGASRKLTLTGQQARAYERAVKDWNGRLARFCKARGIGLASTTTEVPFEELIRSVLRRGGLVS